MSSLSRLSIIDIWKRLGGTDLQGRPPHLRGRASWRDGDGFSISIDADRNCYYDFVAGEGGGVLKLVETARGCDQAEALRWLVAHCGLDDDRQTPAERAAAERDRRESDAFEQALQPDYREFLRQLTLRREVLIDRLRLAADPDAELELELLYDRIDHMRRAVVDEVDADAVELTISIVDLIAEAQ